MSAGPGGWGVSVDAFSWIFSSSMRHSEVPAEHIHRMPWPVLMPCFGGLESRDTRVAASCTGTSIPLGVCC
jgi:hypothetical protein